MFAITKSSLQSKATNCLYKSPILVRHMGTHAQATRKEGDISSVFVSLSGVTPDPLPQRFADIKRQLIQGNESAVTASWKRLLEQLAIENETRKAKRSRYHPEYPIQRPPKPISRLHLRYQEKRSGSYPGRCPRRRGTGVQK